VSRDQFGEDLALRPPLLQRHRNLLDRHSQSVGVDELGRPSTGSAFLVNKSSVEVERHHSHVRHVRRTG
jgi:hypothetical protein